MKFEKIKAGDILFDVHSERMGNTTMRCQGIWEVRVISIDSGTRTAMVRWNSNSPQRYYERQLTRLRASEPKKLNGHFKGCSGYHGGGMWGRKCTCKKLDGEG